MAPPRDGPGRDGQDEIVEFGGRRRAERRPLPRWVPRALLACLALAAVVTVAVRGIGPQGRPAATAPPPPPIRVTSAGHRLLGVTAGWELFARGPDDLLRIQLAQGRVTQTYVPPLETASPDVAFVVGAHEAVIRPSDLVPGYVVPDGGQARPLTGLLSDGGPLVPGPAGSQAAWVTSGPAISPQLSLVALTGHRTGTSIHFQPDGPQVPATAISDGRGDVLVTDDNYGVYDTGPGWDRPVPGTVIAIGPTEWLVDACDPLYLHCRDEVVKTSSGSLRAIGGGVPAPPYYFGWPPTGVISPDGSAAAVAENGRNEQLTVHLVDLRTGATRDLNVPVGTAGGDLEVGGNANENAMVWSPDGRWLFVAATGGKLVVVDTRTGRIEGLGVRLPAVDQVAVRP
ncbi:MAG TPA: hypothetical protein VMC83_32435 [Streptosporangiaceae bacterium]|nr:hypothetical protein [Streptosporangiaceae bacterium]